MTDPDEDLVRRLRSKKYAIANEVGQIVDDPNPHLAADRIEADGKALAEAEQAATESHELYKIWVARTVADETLLAECETVLTPIVNQLHGIASERYISDSNTDVLIGCIESIDALLARIKASKGNPEPVNTSGGPSGPSEGDRKDPFAPRSGDLATSERVRLQWDGPPSVNNPPFGMATAGGADPKPVVWARDISWTEKIKWQSDRPEGQGWQPLVTLDAALAAVQAATERCAKIADAHAVDDDSAASDIAKAIRTHSTPGVP